MPSLSPVNPAFSLRSFPHPPDPRSQSALPAGKGEIFCFLMQGASPLASPGLSRKRHGNRGRTTRPAGGWLFQSPANLTAVVPSGMVRFLCRLSTLPLAYLLSPIPPLPFPSGEGGDFLFSYARGFAPCIPGTEPEAALGQGGEPRARRGGVPSLLPADLAAVMPGGGRMNPNGTCSPCPGGEDHLKRRRRVSDG